MKYELNEQQVKTLRDIVMGLRTNYQERPTVDILLKALLTPIKASKKETE